MRVIGGEFRSRVLKSVPGLGTRPTPDRLREALFNVLAPRIQGAIFADLYAGTGAVGIEALSRGAAKAIFVEQNHAALRVLRENLRALEIEDRTQVSQERAASTIARLKADIVFFDPPYEAESEYERILVALGATGSLAIAQHSVRLKLRDAYESLKLIRVIKQGDNALSFFEQPTD
jgi:16S rRNA (guanine966-N2)-methyltransferase